MARHAYKYSAGKLLKHGLTHGDWPRMWRRPERRDSYDVVIIGGGLHGLATAYYLAKQHGARDVAVRPDAPGRDGLAQRVEGAPGEGSRAGERLVERDAEGELVRAGVGRGPVELLGRHVAQRADNSSGLSETR